MVNNSDKSGDYGLTGGLSSNEVHDLGQCMSKPCTSRCLSSVSVGA